MSVPSIEERREVAERLRNIDTSDEPLNAAIMLVDIKRAIGTFVVRREWPTYESCLADNERTLNRLADLIEPLPERTCTMHRDGHGIWHCSSCEASDERDSGIMPWYDSWPPSFCPNCGARVVEP